MKELSTEQKAKAYDKAKSIMKKYIESGNVGVIAENTIKKAFPELAESEDERIRKELIAMVKLSCTNGDDVDKKIAWLEKQQKPEVDQHSLPVSDNSSFPTFNEDMYHPCTEKSYDWSEEDEKMMAAIEHHLNNCGASITSILWFKSLKDRYAWKPSEEQVRAIDVVRDISNRYSNDTLKALESLYQDLKKLREE